jgi:Ca2+-binding EF-hand superfamily protein
MKETINDEVSATANLRGINLADADEVDSITGLTNLESGSIHFLEEKPYESTSGSMMVGSGPIEEGRARQRNMRMSIGLVDVDSEGLKIVSESKSTQDNKIKEFIRDSIIKENMKISRSELHDTILDTAGIVLSEDILNQLFHKVDKYHDGHIDAKDLANYINSIRQATAHERTRIVMWKVLKSISFWCSVLFFIGSLSSIIVNLCSREDRVLHKKEHYYYQIGAWAFLLGSFGFVFWVYDYESAVCERKVLTNNKLVKWIKHDFPSLYFEKMSKLESTDTLQSSRDLTMSAVLRHQSGDKAFDSNVGIVSLKQLRLILESSGTFFAYDELAQTFKESGMNVDGTVTVQDLIAFAESKDFEVSNEEKKLVTLKQCARNVGFWTSTLFVIGGIAFVPVDFIEGPAALTTNLVRVGCTLYLVAALGGTVNVYNLLFSRISSENRIDSKLRSLAVKLGLLFSRFDKDLVRQSTVNGVTEYHIGWLNEFESSEYQRIGAHHLFDVAGQSGEIEIKEAKLYSMLNDLGVFMSSNDFDVLLGKVGGNRNGRILCSAFVSYIKNLDPDITKDTIHTRMLALLPTSIPFLLVHIQICAATLQVIASYNNFGNTTTTSNFFLAGSFAWLSSSSYNVIAASQTKSAKFDQMQESKFILKEAIVKTIKESTENDDNFERVRTSLVFAAVTTTAENAPRPNLTDISGHSESTMSIWSELGSLSNAAYKSRRNLDYGDDTIHEDSNYEALHDDSLANELPPV